MERRGEGKERRRERRGGGKGGEERKERMERSKKERKRRKGKKRRSGRRRRRRRRGGGGEEEGKRRRKRGGEKEEEEEEKKRRRGGRGGRKTLHETELNNFLLSRDAPQTHNVVSSLEEGEHAGDNSSHSRREQEGACCPFQSCNCVSCSIHSGVAPATVQVASLKSGNMHDTD